MSLEFQRRGIAFARQVPFEIKYKTVVVGEARLDFLVAECLVLELKACHAILPIHVAQVVSYLRVSELSLGVIVNFNVRFLPQGIRRVVRTC